MEKEPASTSSLHALTIFDYRNAVIVHVAIVFWFRNPWPPCASFIELFSPIWQGFQYLMIERHERPSTASKLEAPA